MSKETIQKSRLWIWCCAASSWILLLLLGTMAVHIRLGLGHWPKPVWEDYHTALFSVHCTIVALVFTICVIAPMCLFSFRAPRFRLFFQEYLAPALAYGCGWVVIFLCCKYDPTTFTAWFFD